MKLSSAPTKIEKFENLGIIKINSNPDVETFPNGSKKFYNRRKDTLVLVIHPEAEEIGKILNKAIWR